MTFDELIARARAAQPNSEYNLPALRDYLTLEHLTQIPDETLAEARSYYEPDRNGDAIKVVSIIAGEQRRRSSAATARGQATADQALSWSKRNALIAAVAAIAAIIAAAASIASLQK